MTDIHICWFSRCREGRELGAHSNAFIYSIDPKFRSNLEVNKKWGKNAKENITSNQINCPPNKNHFEHDHH